jgi:hypothetical protein
MAETEAPDISIAKSGHYLPGRKRVKRRLRGGRVFAAA